VRRKDTAGFTDDTDVFRERERSYGIVPIFVVGTAPILGKARFAASGRKWDSSLPFQRTADGDASPDESLKSV
jgi:hypothetical protein